MAQLKISFLFSLFVIFVTSSCTKTNVPNDPPADPPSTNPADTNKPGGILYVNGVGSFYKINTKDSTVFWTSSIVNMFGSYKNPIAFDSQTIYHGNYTGITAYSMQTGITRWNFYWPAFNDAVSFREGVVKDSLIFITSPSSQFDHGYLYCCGKIAGNLHWKVKIDSGNLDRVFNTTPMIINDKVIVMTRDAADHRHLTAFKIDDGARQWSTPANDSLALRLKFMNGKIYSSAYQNVYCYNAADGSLIWQTDLQSGPFNNTYKFFDQNRLILISREDAVLRTATINTVNGSLLDKLNIPAPTNSRFNDCDYYNNTLFVALNQIVDTVSLRAYDFPTVAIKWEKRFATGNYEDCHPLVTDKYCIVPVANVDGNANGTVYFLDLDGNLITGIPLNSNHTDGFIYTENGITYKLNRRYVNN